MRTDEIVGRTEQRAQLSRTLDDVIDDGSRFVIIGGDAGAGKTTVVEAFVAELFGPLADRKAQLIRGQCVPMGGEGLPYAPIVGALRDLVTQHGREQILEWAGVGRRALGALLPDLGTAPREADDTIRLQLFEAVTMLLELITAKRLNSMRASRAARPPVLSRAMQVLPFILWGGAVHHCGRYFAGGLQRPIAMPA